MPWPSINAMVDDEEDNIVGSREALSDTQETFYLAMSVLTKPTNKLLISIIYCSSIFHARRNRNRDRVDRMNTDRKCVYSRIQDGIHVLLQASKQSVQ